MSDPTPAEMLAAAYAADDFTLLFCWRDDDGRWRRDAAQYTELGIADPQVAIDQFWSDRDPEHVLLSCILQGEVATVDEPMFADEPDPEQYAELLAGYEASDQPRTRFTVFAAWDSDGTGHRRYSHHEDAIDPLHAELLTRARTTSGEFLVCGVVELWVPVLDLPEFDEYATPDGKPPLPTTRRGPRRWWPLRAR